MKANKKFLKCSNEFWANVKLVSEKLGYSARRESKLRKYNSDEIKLIYTENGIQFGVKKEKLIEGVVEYLNFRSHILNTKVKNQLMNREEAAREFKKLQEKLNSQKNIIMNRQRGEKRHPAYLSNIVGFLAEDILGAENFKEDTQNLSFTKNNQGITKVFSRRFDGVSPDIVNPIAVWEIKEYYGTTTFGSRVAGTIYETLLDGYEIHEINKNLRIPIKHFLFIDDKYTWWNCGKSYLCRLVDLLHTGHVDEIFFGKEILNEWPKTLRNLKKILL